MRVFAAVVVAVSLSACATQSADIAPSYISPLQYQSFDCAQLTAEGQRLQGRVTQTGGRLDQASSNDKGITVGAILFWPSLFFLGGTKQQEAEYARLKGEYDAVTQAVIAKKC